MTSGPFHKSFYAGVINPPRQNLKAGQILADFEYHKTIIVCAAPKNGVFHAKISTPKKASQIFHAGVEVQLQVKLLGDPKAINKVFGNPRFLVNQGCNNN